MRRRRRKNTKKKKKKKKKKTTMQKKKTRQKTTKKTKKKARQYCGALQRNLRKSKLPLPRRGKQPERTRANGHLLCSDPSARRMRRRKPKRHVVPVASPGLVLVLVLVLVPVLVLVQRKLAERGGELRAVPFERQRDYQQRTLTLTLTLALTLKWTPFRPWCFHVLLRLLLLPLLLLLRPP